MPEPLAYFLTWTCYGTWLPGDERGWVDKHDAGPVRAYRPADPVRRARAAARRKEPPAALEPRQRLLAEKALRDTSDFRRWSLHEVNVRSNHVHVVVTAPHVTPEEVMKVLKAYASRALNGHQRRKHWWTEGGSKRYLNDERSVAAAILYVRDQ
jgi:REP element-mobilizing transposase RayT